MAQADLLVELLKSINSGDQLAFRKIAETLIQEEKGKGHRILADRLTKALRPNTFIMGHGLTPKKNGSNGQHKDFIYDNHPGAHTG